MFSNCRSWLQKPSGAGAVSRHPRLRIGTAHDEWNHNWEALVSMAKGYFRGEGLEDVELIGFADDEAAQIEALVGGHVDICLDPQTRRVLAARDRGAEVYIIGARRGRHSFVIIGQKGMKSLEDLRGQTLTIDEEGAPSLQLRQVLKMAGLEWGKDVKIVHRASVIMHNPIGSEKRFLEKETLVHNVQPWDAEKWTARGYPILADTTKLLPPRQDRIVTAGRIVTERPDTVTSFLKACIKASRFFADPRNQEEIREIVTAAGFLDNDTDRENFPITLDRVRNRVAPDGILPLDGVEQAVKEQKEAGLVSEKLTLDDVLRLDPLRKAQKELGIHPGQ